MEAESENSIADIGLSKASLCGHYEVVQLLLESGALCERDTFQGERYASVLCLLWFVLWTTS